MNLRPVRCVSRVANLIVLATFLFTFSAFGAMQSPIDIDSDHTIFSALSPLSFSYSSNTPVQLLNTGSPIPEQNVKINVPSGAGNLTLDGTIWPLLQFHFHEESEHTVNSSPYDMEFHMVHQLLSGEYLVVGRFLESGSFNPLIDSIFSNLPTTTGSTFDIPSFDLTGLLPSDLSSYRYTGSLTTPPFTEGVMWVVLAEPLQLSTAQIDQFRALFPGGNFREVQDLNGRIITTDVAGFSTVPEPMSAAITGAGLVLLILGPAIRRSIISSTRS
jgi:carbonic anhydrase